MRTGFERYGLFLGILCLSLLSVPGSVSVGQEGGVGRDWETRATEFLEAERILDIDLGQRDLEPYLFSLLDGAWRNDRERIPSLLLQAEELIRREQREGGGWFRSMWNGWTVLAEILSRYNQSVSGEVGIGTYIRLFREDRSGVFPTGGGFVHRNNRSLLRGFLASGGNYESARAMDRLCRELRDQCGSGSMVFLLPTWAHFQSYLRPQQQREVRSWAEEVISGRREGDREIARWVRLGADLHARQERSREGEGGLSAEETRKLEADLVGVLEDESISPAWRHGFAAYLSATMPERMSGELREAIGSLCARVFQEDLPFSSIGMARCLWAFLGTDEETDRWREVARDLEKGWRHRNRFNGQSKGAGRALDPSRLTVIGMMEVSSRLGDREAIDWNLKNFAETYGAFPGMFVSLVRAGYFERAESLLRRRAEEVRYRGDHYLVGPRYDGKLHEQIQKFLQQVPRGEWRTYASLLLSATPDPEPEYPRDDSLPRRRERIVEAAGSLGTRPITDPELRRVGEDILSTVRGGEGVSALLARPPAHFFERFLNEESLDSTELYWLAHHHFYEAMVKLSEGEMFPAQFLWGRFVFEEQEQSRDLQRHGAEAVVDMTHLWLKELLLRGEKEKLGRLLGFGRQVVGTVPVRVYRSDVSDLQNTLLVAHVYCDEMEEYRSWWSVLSVERRQFLGELLYDEMGLVGKAASLLNGGKETATVRFPDEENRRRQFLDLISSPLANAGYTRNEVFGYGYSRELVTETDLVAIAEEAALRAPRGGVALREWFGLLADREGTEKALQTIEEVLTDPEWSFLGDVERFAVRLERALALEAAGRRGEAATELARLSQWEIELPSEMNLYHDVVREGIENLQ